MLSDEGSENIAQSDIDWKEAWRIIPSRFPPIEAFEGLSDNPGDSVILAELEGLTNPRLREQWGEISIIPPERRVSAPGGTYVMAPFSHRNKFGSRFSAGDFGIYYAAREIETAIAETVHHMSLFYAATDDPPHQNDFRCLVGSIDHSFHDIRSTPENTAMDPDEYSAGQALGKALRDAGSDGIAFMSVRNKGGENVAAFWPDVVGIPVQSNHLLYNWNGQMIDRIFDYEKDAWFEISG